MAGASGSKPLVGLDEAPAAEQGGVAFQQSFRISERRGAVPVAGVKGLRKPWSVDRWGRLIAGLSTLTFTGLALVHDPRWLWLTLVGALNLFITSLTDRCMLHDLLIRLGAREREDLFLPGGQPRCQVTEESQGLVQGRGSN